MTQSLSSSPCWLTAQSPNLGSLRSLERPTGFSFVSVSPTPTLSRKSFSFKCRKSDYFDRTFASANNSSFSSQSSPRDAQLPPKYFVGHSIYKGKAALTVEPRAPEFTALDSGAFKLSKIGFVLLQFAPAAGVRVYDWNRKQVFSLSVTEIGSLVSLGARESCEFFHDPFKGKNEEGQVRKVLKVEPLPDGSGHFFNLNVQNKLINLDESIYIPVTKAEFAVLTSALNFMLPYFIGWHAYVSANSMRAEEGTTSPSYGGDYEWNR